MQSVGVAAVPRASARPLLVGLLAIGLGLVPAVSTGLLSPWSAAAATIGYLLGAALIGGSWRGIRFGLANVVTLTRLVGTCWIVGLTIEAATAGLAGSDRLLVIALATGCLILDGVDGRVARARDEVSDFGARFDIETDALLLLSLSLAVPILGVAGWWTVAMAGLRYGYVIAGWFVPALRIPLTHGIFARKAVAVISVTSLIAALAVDLVQPGWPANAILTCGLAALIWSFGRDLIWQLRQQHILHERSAYAELRTPRS